MQHMNVRVAIAIEVAMIQLNLNLTAHACSKGMTQHVFYLTRVQACICMQDW